MRCLLSWLTSLWPVAVSQPTRRAARPLGVLQLEARDQPSALPLPTNETLSTAEFLGNLATRQQLFNFGIHTPTDVDLFSFFAQAGQTAQFDVRAHLGSHVHPFLRLFNGSGEELATSAGTPARTTAKLNFTVPTSGTYFVGVSSRGNDAYDADSGGGATPGDSTGAYLLTLNAPGAKQVRTNPDSPHGEISTARRLGAISKSLVVTHQQIADHARVQMFQFHVNTAQHLAFKIEHPAGSHFDSILRLFDVNGNELQFDDDSALPGQPFSLNSYFEYTFKPGFYYVGVSGYPNFQYDPISGFGAVKGSTGRFSLAIIPGTLVPPESNNTLDKARELGSAAQNHQLGSFYIFPPNDVDLFRFEADAGQQVTITIGHPFDSNLQSFLRLFDAAGNPLAAAGGVAGSQDAQLTYTVSNAGTYYVGVSSVGNDAYNAVTGDGARTGSSEGDYEISLTPGLAPPPNPDTHGRISQALPLALNQPPASATLLTSASAALFAFEVMSPGQAVTITASPAGGGLNPLLRLFDLHGDELQTSTASSGAVTLTHIFDLPGTYFVGVSAVGNAAYNAVTGTNLQAGSGSGAFTLAATSQAGGAPPAPTSRVRVLRSVATALAGASVGGELFYDLHGNGRNRASDPALALQHRVNLGRGLRDAINSGMSDVSTGVYQITQVTPGHGYVVFVVPYTHIPGQADEIVTYPHVKYYRISSLGPGASRGHVDFGIIQGKG